MTVGKWEKEDEEVGSRCPISGGLAVGGPCWLPERGGLGAGAGALAPLVLLLAAIPMVGRRSARPPFDIVGPPHLFLGLLAGVLGDYQG